MKKILPRIVFNALGYFINFLFNPNGIPPKPKLEPKIRRVINFEFRLVTGGCVVFEKETTLTDLLVRGSEYSVFPDDPIFTGTITSKPSYKENREKKSITLVSKKQVNEPDLVTKVVSNRKIFQNELGHIGKKMRDSGWKNVKTNLSEAYF